MSHRRRSENSSGKMNQRKQREVRQNEFEEIIGAFLPSFFDGGFDSTAFVKFLRTHEDSADMYDLLIVKVIRKGFDSNEMWVIEAIAGLLVVAISSGLVAQTMIARAFEKFFHIIDDLAVDVPGIYDTVIELVCTGIDDGVLPSNYLNRTPVTAIKSVLNKQRQTELSSRLEALEDFRHQVKRKLVDIHTDFWNLSAEDAVIELTEFMKPFRGVEFEFRHEVIPPLIVNAMTKSSNLVRENISQLLANTTGHSDALFSREDVEIGFCRVLLNLSDTKLDIPYAMPLLAKFLARAIVDDVLPPAFLRWNLRLHIGGPDGMDVLKLVECWIDPEIRKNLAVKYEHIWKGSDPHSEVAATCRQITRAAVNALYDNDETSVDATMFQIQNEALTPDLASICVRVIVESILERDLEPRVVAIATTLLKKLKNEHEIDGTNVRDAMDYLDSDERRKELEKDVGKEAAQHLGKIKAIFAEAGLEHDDFE